MSELKPEAYMFQHEETGQVGIVDAQQVEWGFENNNPRHQRVGALYSQEQIERLRAELERSEARVRELKEALKPFAHPDLRERIGGQMYSESPVYGRNNATLYINDFERANEALANSVKE